MSAKLSLVSDPLLRGACGAWAGACLEATLRALRSPRAVRVSCSSAPAAGAGGGVFSGAAGRAEFVVMRRDLFAEHFEAGGEDAALGGAGAFFYLAQCLVRRWRRPCEAGAGGGRAATVAVAAGEEEGGLEKVEEEDEEAEDEEEEEELADLQSAVPAWPLGDGAPPPDVQAVTANLWMSPRATTSALHTDDEDNLLCVLRGRKVVALVAPGAARHLRPAPEGTHCEADVFTAGGAPTAAGARFVEARAGDVVLIAKGVWHAVRSDAGTVAINFWSQKDWYSE